MTTTEGVIKVQNEVLTIKDNNTQEVVQLQRTKTTAHIKEKEILNEKTNEKEEEEERKNKEKEKKENKEYIEKVKKEEDTCSKCPLRCLVFIPICCGYSFLSIYDLIAYLIAPLFWCIFYSITFICTSCANVISSYQVEEEVGFSGAFTSENEIQIHINNEGGVLHLREIVCFSYMSTCIKRYFCFIFVLINHILVPIFHGWQKAKNCFLKSKIEELYDERIKQVENISSYKGYDQNTPPIELSNI